MKELSKEDIIKETARFYNSTNRGYDYSEGSCAYLAPNGSKCAVGRCILSKHINKVKNCDGGILDLRWHLRNKHNIQFEDVLIKKYRGHSPGFWTDLQNFHDEDYNFDYNGLTSTGKKRLEILLDKYRETSMC